MPAPGRAPRRWVRWRQWLPARLISGWYARRPYLTTAGLLAAGMVLLILLFARDAGLRLRQHVILAAITVGLAALCTWIIFLEHGEPAADGEA